MSVASKEVTKSHCYYCGNNQTNHTAAWIDSLVLIGLNRWLYAVLQTWFGWLLVFLTDHLFAAMLWVFERTGIARFTTDHTVITSGRGQVMAAEADRRGWVMEVLVVFGLVHDAYRLTLPPRRRIFFSGVPRLGRMEAAISGWMDDKALLKKRLREHGVTVSRGDTFTRLAPARAFFETLHKPVIIKPRFGSRGRHTTTHIYTAADFEKAFWIAKQLCIGVIVEEHLVGSVYRGTMIGGKLAGVLSGVPPRVTGDGVHTIAELVTLKNATRPARVGEVLITDVTKVFLSRLNYTLETILPIDTTIDMTEKIGLSYGGSSQEDTPLVHPKLRTALEAASAAVHDSIHGFDFISPDISADPDTVRWGIIECNSVPFIDLHHHPLLGNPINVAGILFDDLAKHA